MGTGWRRAFCTTIPRDRVEKLQQHQEQQQQQQNHHQKQSINHQQGVPVPSPSPRSCAKFGFLTGGSNPSTPRMQSAVNYSSRSGLRCKTNASVQQRTSSDNDNFLISPNNKLHCRTTANTPKSSSTTTATTKSPRPFRSSNPSSPRSPFSILKHSLRLSRVL